MTIALALLSSEIVGNRILKRYSVTASGSYATSGTTGDLIDFQGATNTSWIPRAKFARVPDGYKVCNHPAGWEMRIEPGATFSTFGLRFFQTGTGADLPFNELANGAYPASITGSDGSPLQIELSSINI